MTDLELSITQYLDGSLSVGERAALEHRLESDAEARVMLDEHRKIDVLLKASPVPQIRWDALAEQISSAVANVEIPVEAEPARGYRMNWMRIGMPMAIAAALLIGVGVAFHLFRPQSPNPTTVSQPQAIAVITGPQVETTTAASDVQITVGPAQVAASDDSMLWRYSDDVTSRPAHVTVASGINPAQDSLPVFDMQ
jgi:anti-sigma factor RsiW